MLSEWAIAACVPMASEIAPSGDDRGGNAALVALATGIKGVRETRNAELTFEFSKCAGEGGVVWDDKGQDAGHRGLPKLQRSYHLCARWQQNDSGRDEALPA